MPHTMMRRLIMRRLNMRRLARATIAATALTMSAAVFAQAPAPAPASPPPSQVSPTPVQPGPNAPVLPQRTINITAEQGHTIKEIVLDPTLPNKPAKVSKGDVAIGGKVGSDISLQPFPALATDKVPAIRNHKFFVNNDQIVIVDDKDNTVSDIIK